MPNVAISLVNLIKIAAMSGNPTLNNTSEKPLMIPLARSPPVSVDDKSLLIESRKELTYPTNDFRLSFLD
jgi:hypothetical protein